MLSDKKIIIYGHAGAYNHGAEALTSCLISLLRREVPGCRILLSTHFAEQDKEFSIDADEFLERDLNATSNHEVYASTIKRIDKDSICIHIGGDNYCYKNWQRYALIHREAVKKGAVSILLGCSIDADVIDDEMLNVLHTHNLITAREKITYQVLVEKGLSNVVLSTDIAFSLKPMPVAIHMNNFVAINLSPLVLNQNPKIQDALKRLADFILTETDMNIVLTPHCLVSVSDDRDALRKIYTANEGRVRMINENLSAGQYKSIISRARFCVSARTHAVIAAYSSLVPTLALGYSVKSHGIAMDLEMEDYIVDVRTINEADTLLGYFKKLMENEREVRGLLAEKIPEYKQNIVSLEFLNLIKG